MTPGSRLKYARTRKNLSQQELGVSCGWDTYSARSRVSHYENNKREMSVDVASKIAEILEIDPGWLLLGDNEEVNSKKNGTSLALEKTVSLIGEKIKKRREALGLSQQVLAELCGWDLPSRISNYECGLREPGIGDLQQIANALKIEVSYLINADKKVASEKETLAGRLASLMQEKGYTQHKLAAEVGLSQQSIYEILQEKTAQPRKIEKLAKIFDVDPGWLQFGLISRAASKSIDNKYSIQIKDDSMTSPIPYKRSFFAGDTLIIDPDKPISNGCVVLLALNEEEVVRQYVVGQEEQVLLRPFNPIYPKINLSENIKILGVVTQIISDV